MARIGIDIRNIGKKRTGDEAVFFGLAKGLAKIDAENKYFLFTDMTAPAILEDIAEKLEIKNKNNFEIVSLVAVRPLHNKFGWNMWTLPKYLRQNPLDVYLTQYITPFFVPKKIRIATIVHDISFKIYSKFIKFSDLFFLKILIPLSFRRADKIIGVSKFTAEEIKKYYGISADKIAWIHNAVSEDFLRQDITAEKILEVKKKYHLPDEYILYLGTLQPRKNIPVLLEAFAKIKLGIGAKLVIAGGRGHNFDPRIDTAVCKFNLRNDVFFPGYIDEKDKAALLKGARIFCFPSLYEGFGIPILEAMTVGTPVIASDIPPHREIANKSVSFFDPKSSEDLAAKIQQLFNNPDLGLVLAQRSQPQAKNFSWEKTARDMVCIFNSLD
ncbi:MAG: glycosyltransferase family 1 protein [Parcubacteria group bacterium]